MDDLEILVKVSTEEASKKLDELADRVSELGDAVKQNGMDTKASGQQSEMAYAAMAAAAVSAFNIVVGAIKSGIDAVKQYESATKGLESVSAHVGIDSGTMREALQGVTDEFFDATAAATSYKNLLSRGYSLDQATKTIVNLKNAAAFGRQASYSLRDAVVTATEGLKNENSILVDNAGVTKNVAKMWDEYAKKIGVGVQSLTQAQKIEAEYAGIVAETTAQMGDLAKMSDTLAGAEARAQNETQLMTKAFGEAIEPTAQLGNDVFAQLMIALKGIITACPEVVSGVTTATGAFMGMLSLTQVIAMLKKFVASAQLAGASLGWVKAIAAVIGVAVAAYTAIKNAADAAREAEEARVQGIYEAANEQQKSVDAMDAMIKRYEELTQKSDLTYDEQKELAGLQQDLSDAYGVSATGMDGLTLSTREYIKELKESRRLQLEELQGKKTEAANTAREEAYAEEVAKAFEKKTNALNDYIKIQNKYAEAKALGNDQDVIDGLEKQMGEAKAILDGAQANLDEHSGLFANWYEKAVEDMATQVQVSRGTWDSAIADMLGGMFDIDLSDMTQEQATAYVDQWVRATTEAASNADLSDAIASMQDIMDNINAGFAPSDDDMTKIAENYEVILSAAQGVAEDLGLSGDEAESFAARLVNTLSPISMLGLSLDDLGKALTKQAEDTKKAGKSSDDYVKSIKKMEDEVKDLETRIKSTAAIKANVQAWNDLRKEYDDVAKAGGDVTDVNARMKTTAAAMNKAYDGTADSLSQCDKEIAALSDSVDAEGASIESKINSLMFSAQQLEQDLNMNPDLSYNVSPAIAAIQNVITWLNSLITKQNEAGLATTDKEYKPRGGGGRRDDDSGSSSSAATVRESAYEKAINKLEHLKALDKQTLEQELKYLGKINAQAKKYKLTTEERLDLAERIYDVKKQIAERDAESLDSLSSAITDALRGRYEAMRDAETEALDQSRESWEKWRDENTAAIQAQIDALDALADAEDRESAKAEKQRAIAKLSEQVQYEQDAYNRAKLQQQLDAAKDAYDELLRKYDREDQKAALEAQIEQIDATADSEIAKLDEQQKAMEAAYDKRLEKAALTAETEKLMMEQTQDEIVKLLAAYADDYSVTGETLGEKMLEGFKKKVGSVVTWFNKLNKQLTAEQEQMAALAMQTVRGYETTPANAAPGVGVTNVSQTVNFNQPLQSEAEAARLLKQTNTQLAEDILRG